MDPADIQHRLKKRGIKQRKLAEDLGVSETAVSFVIHRKSVSDRIMRAISDAIGEDPHFVFVEYYFSRTRRKKAA